MTVTLLCVWLSQALTYYQKVLMAHPENIYAANGVGAILAEQVCFECAAGF